MSLFSRFARGTAVTALAACLYLPSAYGAVLYDEAVSGDLGGNQATYASVGTFALGTNTIRGAWSRASDIGALGIGDAFKVALDPQHVVSAVSVTLSNYTGADQLIFVVARPTPFSGLQSFSGITGNQTITFNPALLTTSELGFSLQPIISGQPTTVNWEWNVEVAPAPTGVPEASSVSLMAAGLAALTVLGRRQITRR